MKSQRGLRSHVEYILVLIQQNHQYSSNVTEIFEQHGKLDLHLEKYKNGELPDKFNKMWRQKPGSTGNAKQHYEFTGGVSHQVAIDS